MTKICTKVEKTCKTHTVRAVLLGNVKHDSLAQNAATPGIVPLEMQWRAALEIMAFRIVDLVLVFSFS
eukprot:UN01652